MDSTYIMMIVISSFCLYFLSWIYLAKWIVGIWKKQVESTLGTVSTSGSDGVYHRVTFTELIQLIILHIGGPFSVIVIELNKAIEKKYLFKVRLW